MRRLVSILCFSLALAVSPAIAGAEGEGTGAQATATPPPHAPGRSDPAAQRAKPAGASKEAAGKASGRKAASSARLEQLRRDCYGGRGKPMPEFARQHHLNRAMRGVREKHPVKARDAFRKVLRAGGDEKGLIPGLIKAFEGTGEAADGKAAKSCGELVEAL